MPEPRAGYAAGVLDGKLVIAGGTFWEGTKGNWIAKRFSATTDAFDPVAERWDRLPEMPLALGYAASAVINNRLYVLGGYTGQQVSRKVYTSEKNRKGYVWRIFGELPEGVFLPKRLPSIHRSTCWEG